MEQARIKFYETESIEYSLIVETHVGERKLQSVPYVKNDDAIGKDIGGIINVILESRGYKKKNFQIIIFTLNQNNQRNLSNPNIPEIVNKKLEELNYSSCIN